MKKMDLSGKTALITGASRGIGEAAAREFAKAGANVALIGRSTDDLARIAGDIGDRALAIPCDVARYGQIEQAVAVTAQTFGGLDVLVNNAGVVEPMGHFVDLDPEAWSRAVDINLKGVMHGMRAVIPGMIAQGHGTILNISSGAAHNPVHGWTAYCASKAGAYMLTRTADLECRDKGLRIIGLSPGTVATKMQRDIKESGVSPVSQLDWSVHIPPEWPARALVWMCGPDADAYLGQDISLRDDDVRQMIGLA